MKNLPMPFDGSTLVGALLECFRLFLARNLAALRVPLAVVALLYAIVAVARVIHGDATLAAGRDEAALYVISWTFGPPLWFVLETWATPAGGRAALRRGQALAMPIWAAALLAILILVTAAP